MDSSYISQRSFPDKNSKNLSTAPMSPPLSPKSSSSTTSTKKSFKISDIIIINSDLRSGNDNDNDNNVNDIPIANSYHYCRRRQQQQQQQQQPSPPSDHHHLYENAFHSYTKTTTNENLNSIIIDTTGNRISPICDTSNGKSFFNNPNTTITNLSSSGSTLYNVNTNTNGVSNNSNFYPIRNSNNGYDYYSNNNNNNNNNSFNNHIYNISSVCDINTKKSRMDINFIIDDDIMNNDNNDDDDNNDIRRHDENNNNKNDNVESEIDIRFFNNNNNNNNNIYSYIGNNNDYNHHNKYKNKYDFNSSSNRFRLPSINEISGFEFNQEQIFLDSFGGGNNNGGCGDGNGNGGGGGRMRKTTSNNKNKRSSDEINNSNDNDNYRNQITKSPSKKVKRSGTSSSSSSSQRKGKGNSLARVMADRGLLRTSFNADITAAEIKSVRIPPPPSLSFDELMLRINQLQLDTRVLDTTAPSITWKGHPLQIEHLPHYNALHPTEALVVSILRLTPIQYLTGKHTLISSARRYIEKDLPFKKSDAQKLLRIDVNKASKLWDFFHQMNWIQL